MGQGNRFAFVFFGCIAFWLGLFFWGVQRMPPPPLMPPPVTMDAASLAAFAAKQAAIADDMPKFYARRGFVEVRIHNVTRPAYRPLEALAVALGLRGIEARTATLGGVFGAGKPFLAPFGRHLRRLAPGAPLVPPRFPPVVGALILSYRAAEVPVDTPLLAALSASLGEWDVA